MLLQRQNLVLEMSVFSCNPLAVMLLLFLIALFANTLTLQHSAQALQNTAHTNCQWRKNSQCGYHSKSFLH